MVDVEGIRGRNLLLASLRSADLALLHPYLKRATHQNGDVLAEMRGPIDRVFFPEGGVAAFLAVAAGGHRTAAGVVGLEGMIGVGCLLGEAQWTHAVVLRGQDASALVIDTDRLIDACARSTTLQAHLLKFAGILMMQFARTGTANLVTQLERRMARWILLYHDRLDGDEFPMTHEEIAIMLGVRRASATDILHVLEGEQAIRNLRGRLVIRDRARLEEIAGDSYGDVEANYRSLIGPFGKISGCSAVSVPADRG